MNPVQDAFCRMCGQKKRALTKSGIWVCPHCDEGMGKACGAATCKSCKVSFAWLGKGPGKR